MDYRAFSNKKKADAGSLSSMFSNYAISEACRNLFCIGWLCLIAVAACDGSQRDHAPAKEEATLATESRPATLTLDLDGARWEITQQPRGQLELNSLEVLYLEGRSITPVANTPVGLQAHLLGAPLDTDLPHAEIEALLYVLFRQVPGVPLGPRYEDEQFDIVREGFTTGCRDAVKGYQSFIAKTLLATDPSAMYSLLGTESIHLAGSYEDECLTQLDDVPAEIRRVLGVLSIGGAPFCSGTIIDTNKLITSRHCFSKSSTGNTKPALQHWKDGNLAFITAEPHNGRHDFKVSPPSSATLASLAQPFTATQDYWLLETTRRFAHKAMYEAAPDDTTDYPVLAWLVGTNINLDDFGTPQTPLGLIRGSAPTACAILERTDAGCVYHTCQSSPATSGAGIFHSDVTEGVRVLGVHKGTIVEAGSCESSPPVALQLNMGITDLVL